MRALGSGMKPGFKYDSTLTRKWINNGVNETQIWFKQDEEIKPPEGYVFGRLKTGKTAWNHGIKMSEETCNKLKELHKNNRWFNNGEKEILVRDGKDIPEGFIPGRIFTPASVNLSGELNPNYGHKWSDEQRMAASERARLNPTRWTDEQKLNQSNRLKGKNTWSKGRKRNPIATAKWIKAMQDKTPEEKLQMKLKEYKTKKINKSFSISRPEKLLYKKLVEDNPGKTILKQYLDKDRYPFYCDFYIVEDDLFIELNAHWTHGFRPYDSEDPWCQQQLREWQEKAKQSQYYVIAIDTWTRRDVEKLQCAKNNNLNYKVLYE